MSSAVGSAIRDIGSAHRMGGVDCGLSPAIPGGMNVSPTLQLMPNLGTAPGMGQVSHSDALGFCTWTAACLEVCLCCVVPHEMCLQ
jgi:hypothetical protein